MNLYKEAGEAYNHGCTRYFKTKNEELIHVFPCKIGRSEFYTVLSSKEAKKYKVSLTKAIFTFGERESEQKIRADVQARISDPKTKEYATKVRYIKTLRQHLRAEEKLKKLNTDDAK